MINRRGCIVVAVWAAVLLILAGCGDDFAS